MKFKYIFTALLVPLLLSYSCNRKGESVNMDEIQMDTTLVSSIDKAIKNDTLNYKVKKDGYVLNNGLLHIRIEKTEEYGYFTYLTFDKEKVELTRREQDEVRKLSDNYINNIEKAEQDKLKEKLKNYINKK